MKNDSAYIYTKIRPNIWHIEEDFGVYCTLIIGKSMAILVDTGFGNRNLRSFVEENISTPYLVVNSHGHPDHIGGNHWFDTVYALKEEWDVIRHFEKERTYQLEEVRAGQQIDLGDLHVDIVALPGHTQGSIGLLVQEEKILIAGDALNESLWLFNYGSLSMKELYETLQRTVHMGFSTYLCGHSDQEYQREKIFAHIHNMEHLKVDESTIQNTIGFETYCSSYSDQYGDSNIVFTEDKVSTAKPCF